MRQIITIGLSLVAAACGTGETPRQTAIMDKIEHGVTLPVGAAPLKTYARSYTDTWDQKVIGVYAVSTQDHVPIGGRRWFKDIQHISSPAGQGCAVVYVIYDLRKKRLATPFCKYAPGSHPEFLHEMSGT